MKRRGIPIKMGCTWAQEESLLHIAAREGRVEMIVDLLENGMFVDPTAPDGATPLHYAAANNHIEVVKILLDHGANPRSQDKQRRTPLDYARVRHADAVISLLLPTD